MISKKEYPDLLDIASSIRSMANAVSNTSGKTPTANLVKIETRLKELADSTEKIYSKQKPSPLDLLEIWAKHKIGNAWTIKAWNEPGFPTPFDSKELIDFIHKLRTDPEAVIEQGRKEGWLSRDGMYKL